MNNRTISKIKNKLLLTIFKYFPYKKQVMFLSYQGQYNDNPKYVSLKLHERNPDLKLIWVISDRCHEKENLPDYIKIVGLRTSKYYLERSRSYVLVDGGWGFMSSNIHKMNFFSIKKRKKQLNISTWHGTPIKKIGADYKSDYNNFPEKKDFYSSSDYMIAGCEYTKEKLKSAFYNVNVLLTGTPRNDVLINPEINISCLKEKLKLPKDSKILLFAPTYRENPYDSGITQLKNIDIKLLLKHMSNKFGGNWKMVYRVHNMVLDVIDNELIDFEYCINGNIGDDMQEYLLCSDALISDYSSVVFDIALTEKPCFLFAHDFDKYVAERGMYIGMEKLPYSFSKTFTELLLNIDNYCHEQSMKKKSRFLKKIGNLEDGNASDRIAELIETHINKF